MGGIITAAAGIGVAILSYFVGAIALQVLGGGILSHVVGPGVPLVLGAGFVAPCVGLELIAAARVVERHDSSSRAG